MASVVKEPITLVIDPVHLALIGKVATLWGSLELAMNGAIWVLLGTDLECAAATTAQIQGWAGKLNALYALVSLHNGSDKLLEKIEKFSRKTNGIAQKRNRIVHDPWMLGKESGVHYRLEISWTSDRRFTFEHKPERVEDLGAVIKEIDTHTARFWELWAEIKSDAAVQKSWRGKRRKPFSDPQIHRPETETES